MLRGLLSLFLLFILLSIVWVSWISGYIIVINFWKFFTINSSNVYAALFSSEILIIHMFYFVTQILHILF